MNGNCARPGCGHPALKHQLTSGCMLEIAEEVECPCYEYIEPAPPPTTENARAGADEQKAHELAAVARVQMWHAINRYAESCGADTSTSAYGNIPRMFEVEQIESGLVAVLTKAVAAGRARGIEEAGNAVTKLCDEYDGSADVHCGLRMAENQVLAIADAIAKETTK